MTVLITGGAGYIGSHMALSLIDAGEDVVILDNLSTGVRSQVPHGAHFVAGDVGDKDLVRGLLREHDVDAVLHFAASTVVPESVADPLSYYANNTVASRVLIEACVDTGIENFIFSSTAAVYGATSEAMVSETAATHPESPYGRSKLMTEWMLEDASRASRLRHVSLRYFNVAGADPAGRTGQSTPNATHLIKRACQAAIGVVPHLAIFGADYPTPDGTGVRDYIHVTDLVSAHAVALQYLRAGGAPDTFNCGYGRGFSVREVARAVEQVVGAPLPVVEMPRRPGDCPAVVADNTKIRTRLGWTPEHDDLEMIVRTALDWERRLAQQETSAA
ncbi:MAG: UDP-glucose 4-epimerase GalE [Phenylobacterium sp.]|jgi:UDP-glucose 4-epimerase|uniref:UDP-glucose 4-epimerase GalE n=1 Tax=Phenylobacterium sp. TaxID=1871053 RepID=UPI002A3645CC|nr:UDP-glucose 4-epimerase GalE [Phenylobacterium sp.]MDX9998575.1 UDP-glucose 4-epimerase GalE [Phenylobacterium sp.]